LHFKDRNDKIPRANIFLNFKPAARGTMRFSVLGFLTFGMLCAPLLLAQPDDTPMTVDELGCLQKMIFFNECSGKAERMTTWNEDEAFPSFGIGHFIWYPANYAGPYKELFPEFLSFMEAQKEELPAWIKALPARKAPWQTRQEFLSDLTSERMTALRDFLNRTQGLQAQFMTRRVEGILPRMLATVPEVERPEIELKFKEVADAPKGMFALIDYVNFKGEGILDTERSQGKGWGLLQVLEEMRLPKTKEKALEEFVRAAKKVLETRARNAPPEKDCTKRLCGWKARIKNYEKIRC